MTWVAVHAQREFWAMSKKAIKADHPDTKNTALGAIDTSLFLSYALAQFGTGMIGDMFTKRKVLSVSFTIQAVFFVFVGLIGLGVHDFHKAIVLLCLAFVCIGLV